jgi:hypothetical protein
MRPPLPDLPTFARPPFRACKFTGKVFGRDEFGGECPVLDVRGWGYLTGKGQALDLPAREAMAAIVKTAEFIAKLLNEAYAKEAA